MARMEVPLSIASAFTLETLAEFLLAQSTPAALRSNRQRELLDHRRAPYNLDAWDGYPAARESVLSLARSQNKNLVSLAGDTHNAWASVLTDAAGQRVGMELATASVVSAGFEVLLPFISGPVLTDAIPKMVKDLRYTRTSKRDYLVLTATPAEVAATGSRSAPSSAARIQQTRQRVCAPCPVPATLISSPFDAWRDAVPECLPNGPKQRVCRLFDALYCVIGNSTIKVAPPPGRASQRTVPPWRSLIDLTSASPRPTPPSRSLAPGSR